MDLAKTLIRSVARAFYETKHILVVDALLVHSALRDDDLAHLLGMQTKELRKLCAKLDEHRLLAVHNRQEIREGMQRPISRTYYYVDFRQTIDAIKYRIYRVTKEVEALVQPTDEKKDYYCPRCGSRWTQMEVLDSPGVNGFNCHKCGTSLERDDNNVGDGGGGHEVQSKLMKQLEPLLGLLPRIDEVVIPDNTFETAFNAAVPVQRNQRTNPITAMVPVEPSSSGSLTAVKGMSQTAPQRIEVDLTSSEDKTAAEQAAEAGRKSRLAEQNALPVWHTNSTVTGEKTTLGSKDEMARREREQQLTEMRKEESEEKKAAEAAEMTDEVAQYYAQLARDQQKAEAEEESSSTDEDEGEDDEDEFEDVPAAAASTTPSKSQRNEPAAIGMQTSDGKDSPSKAINGSSMARDTSQGSESSSSARTTSTPGAAPPTSITVNNNDEDNEERNDARPSKRLKLDDDAIAGQANGNSSSQTETKAQPTTISVKENDDDDEEEEEVEFEDV